VKEFEYDLVAIGGGTAGLVSAAGASYIGARSALVERDRLGGDCLWTGCVPSKALIASARLAHAMRNADELGLVGSDPAHAFSEVMERMRHARGVVAHHDEPERFREMGVGVHFGRARFLDSERIEVEGVGRIRAPRFVVATGAVASVPPIPGLDEAGYLTHATAFEQTTLPARLVVLGAGPIGLEFAQLYHRLGAEVTVVEMLPRILPREEPDVAEALRSILEEEGIRLHVRTRASEVRLEGGDKIVVSEDGERFEGDEIFVATGRRPATAGLDLEKAGIAVADGSVRVDDGLRTTSRRAWAAGDVTGGPQFTHVADYMAKTVVRNALLPLSRSIDYSTVPRVTYTDPEVAHVGLSSDEAEVRGGTSHRYDFADLDRAIVDGATAGFVRISADRKGRGLGGTVLAHGAGDLLLPVVLAMKHGLTLGDVTDTIFPYPTMSEGVLRAAQGYRRSQLDTMGGRILKKVVSWLA